VPRAATPAPLTARFLTLPLKLSSAAIVVGLSLSDSSASSFSAFLASTMKCLRNCFTVITPLPQLQG
jgi:hypothetical protein